MKRNTCSHHAFDFYNYRPKVEKVPTRLYIASFAAVGTDWWLANLEYSFYNPEVTRKFMQQSSFIQYRRTKRFESLTLGKDAIHFCYRLSHSWIVEAVPQISLGFNRWNDWDKYSHDIYDLFNLSCSLREVIQFNPLDKKSILFTTGLIQDIYYIHSLDWKINPGLVLGFGFKF